MIRMAYNHYPYIFELDENDSMVEYPWNWGLGRGPVAHDILSTFFASQNLTPTWKECNGDWGTFNKTTALWAGAVAEVSKLLNKVGYDKADLRVTSSSNSEAYNKVLDVSPAIYYGQTFWVTKSSKLLSPATNLLRIFDANCWILFFVSLTSVSVFLVLASLVGDQYGLKSIPFEVVLSPFR